MPFYYVQLSSLNRPSWPWFRDSQRRLMYEIPNTGMVVSSDCGDSIDVHPRNKRPIGERLARWALSDTYKYNLLPTGPLFKKAIVTHIGTNPETVRQMNCGELEVELVPMGTLIERIRAAGAGLGGILTPTGVGTVVEQGKKTVEIDGRKFLFEKPLSADVAIIYGTKVDKFGNIFLEGTTRNFNQIMATAAKTVIVEADEIVDSLDPNMVTIPGIFVDYIVAA